jgi:hypothetical protein
MGTNYNKLRTPTNEHRRPTGSKLQRRGGVAVALVALAAAGCGASAKATSAVEVNKASAAPGSTTPHPKTTKPKEATTGAYDLSRTPLEANLCAVPGITQKLVALFRGRLTGATDITVSSCTPPTPAVEATGWTVGYKTKFGIPTSGPFSISDGPNQTLLQGPATIPALRGATVYLTLSSGNIDVLVGPAHGYANSEDFVTTDGIPGINQDGTQLSFDGQQSKIATLGNKTADFLVGSGVLAAYFPAKG